MSRKVQFYLYVVVFIETDFINYFLLVIQLNCVILEKHYVLLCKTKVIRMRTL